MKRYGVYGVDSTTALKEFDTFDDALIEARKNLRKWGKSIKDREEHKWVYHIRKNAYGVIIERDLR